MSMENGMYRTGRRQGAWGDDSDPAPERRNPEGPIWEQDPVQVILRDSRGNERVISTRRILLSGLREAAAEQAKRERARESTNPILADGDRAQAFFLEELRDAIHWFRKGAR